MRQPRASLSVNIWILWMLEGFIVVGLPWVHVFVSLPVDVVQMGGGGREFVTLGKYIINGHYDGRAS